MPYHVFQGQASINLQSQHHQPRTEVPGDPGTLTSCSPESLPRSGWRELQALCLVSSATTVPTSPLHLSSSLKALSCKTHICPAPW